MHQHIFVNLPVKNLEKSKAFFTKLGYTFNRQFTNEKAACLVLGENLFAMLLVKKFFQTFIKKDIADAHQKTEVLVALSVTSRQEADRLIEQAVAAGGRVYRKTQDEGWMYSRAYEDLDGHQWELVWMDPSKIDNK